MRSLLSILAIPVVLMLGACTHMTPSECKQADWYAIGLQDGDAGEDLSTLDDRRKSCAEAGVTVDTNRYLEGRSQGLARYCHPSNAFEVGLQGKSYRGVCPSGGGMDFRRRFEIGREVHQSRQALRDMDRERNTLEEKLRKAGNDDDRRKLRAQLGDLDDRMRRARNRVRDAEDALDRARRN